MTTEVASVSVASVSVSNCGHNQHRKKKIIIVKKKKAGVFKKPKQSTVDEIARQSMPGSREKKVQ